MTMMMPIIASTGQHKKMSNIKGGELRCHLPGYMAQPGGSLGCYDCTACIQAAGRDEGHANEQALPRTATAQKTGEASRAHSPHVRAECPLGKGGHGASPGHWGE